MERQAIEESFYRIEHISTRRVSSHFVEIVLNTIGNELCQARCP